MVSCVRVMVVCGVLVALSACGGGGSTSSSASMAGPWSGFYSAGSSSTFTNATVGAFSSAGNGYFADNNGNVYVLYNLSGASPYTATLTAVAPVGQTFTNGQTTINFAVTGKYLPSGPGINMLGNFNENDNQGALSGSFNLTTDNPYTGTSTLAGMEGQ